MLQRFNCIFLFKPPWCEDLVNKNSSFADFASICPYTYARTQTYLIKELLSNAIEMKICENSTT